MVCFMANEVGGYSLQFSQECITNVMSNPKWMVVRALRVPLHYRWRHLESIKVINGHVTAESARVFSNDGMYSPPGFCYYHFGPQFVKFVPEFFGLQVALDGQQIVTVAGSDYFGRGL